MNKTAGHFFNSNFITAVPDSIFGDKKKNSINLTPLE